MSSSSSTSEQTWQFSHFGLIVTGEGEEQFLPELFRSITATTGRCSFKVIRRIGQRWPITSERRKLRMIGTGKVIPDRDATEIGLPARRFLSANTTNFFVLIDDLEKERSADLQPIFDRYRLALNTMLDESQARRASVHFLVNMLEAYFFADIRAVNAILGTELEEYDGDVETIRNPKGKLKKQYPGFDEIADGHQIVEKLDMSHVLSRKETCASLRTMFAWIYRAIGEPAGEVYQLLDGRYNEVTKPQICALPQARPEVSS